MTPAERQLIADLAARIERLERLVAELTQAKPAKTSLCLYPKQPHEKQPGRSHERHDHQ